MKTEHNKILLIEENRQVADEIRTILSDSAHEYIIAENWEAGAEMANSTDVALVLLCCNISAKCELNSLNKEKALIFLVSDYSEEMLTQAFAQGANDVIAMPFRNVEVLLRIGAHIKQYQHIAQLKADNQLLTLNVEELSRLSDLVLQKSIKLFDSEEQFRLKTIALQHSEKQFKMAVKSANAGVFTVNNRTGELFFDKRTLEIFGISKKEFKNDYISWRKLVHPEDVGRLERILTAFIGSPNKNLLKAEYRIIKPDGTEGYVLAWLTTERDETQLPYEIFGLHIDFTEKRNAQQALYEIERSYRNSAEQKLTESEQKYKKLFESKNEAVVILDAQTYRIIDANSAACRLYGYTKDEILTLTPFDISLEKNDTREKLHELQTLNSLQTIKDRVCTTKNGESLMIEITNTVMEIDDNKIIYSTHKDITNQQLTLQKLRQSEQIFRGLVENINEVFIIFNLDFQIPIYISPQIENLLGYTSDEVLKSFMTVITYIHLEDVDRLKNAYKTLMEGKEVTEEFRIFRKDKAPRWVNFRSFGLSSEKSENRTVYAILRDITERKFTERKILNAILETENRERETFAKELHDSLGANLSAIKMYLERIVNKQVNDKKIDTYLQEALKLIIHAAQTSREISHGLKPHLLTNMGLIKSIESLCSSINGIGKVTIEFTHNCPNLKLSNEIELSIYRIINELINNTLKYSEAQVATIEIVEMEVKVCLNYTDNGKGFDPQDTTNKGNGLNNIKSRVDSLSGTLSLQSSINQGIKVNIQIPSHSFLI